TSGVIYKQGSNIYSPDEVISVLTGGDDIWDTTRYLNIWVVKEIVPAPNNVLFLNAIYLRTGAKGNWNIAPQEQTILAYLAAQCPYTGGTAVFEARDMLQVLGISADYDDVLLCATHGIALRQKPKTPTQIESIKFYPNPANDYLLIEGRSEGSVTITDILGRIVYNQKYEGGKQVVSTIAFAQGIYTITFTKEGSEFHTTNKLAIIHIH
ncbi:MAG: hypothetical protein RI894_1585, partial [Bacteroidota bacterium]